MARKSDFTSEEWETLQNGVFGAGLLVTASDRRMFGTLSEGRMLNEHLRKEAISGSPLISELAATRPPKLLRLSGTEDAERQTLDALRDSIALLEAKAPDEVEPYRTFVIELVEAVAGAAKGAGRFERLALNLLEQPKPNPEAEHAVVARIRAALGERPSF